VLRRPWSPPKSEQQALEGKVGWRQRRAIRADRHESFRRLQIPAPGRRPFMGPSVAGASAGDAQLRAKPLQRRTWTAPAAHRAGLCGPACAGDGQANKREGETPGKEGLSKSAAAARPVKFAFKATGSTQGVDGLPQDAGAAAKGLFFGRIQRQRDFAKVTRTANEMGQRQRNSFTPGHTDNPGANREDGALVVENHINDSRHRATDAVVGGAFAGDYLVGGVANVLVDRLPLGNAERPVLDFGEVIQAEAGDGGLRPNQH